MSSTVLDKPTGTATVVARQWLVAWTGGYDQPSYALFLDPAVADERFTEWKSQARDSGDVISLIEQTIYDDQSAVVTVTSEWMVGQSDEDDQDGKDSKDSNDPALQVAVCERCTISAREAHVAPRDAHRGDLLCDGCAEVTE